MSTSKHIDVLSLTAILLAAAITISCLIFAPKAAGSISMGYESKLFDTSVVHTIDIVMEDWDSFIEKCENEEYELCSLVIDGETFRNVGIRGKGNTSLSSVSSMDSTRYSFKVEFDQYTTNENYYGLDKLSLNNLIYDNTMMKDYLVYEMMRSFGAPAPLCSFVYITVNGEDFGLYLAIEGIEDSFLRRNYGNDYGNLYKPDSMNFGGGRGNGRDFNMNDFTQERDMENYMPDNSQNRVTPSQDNRSPQSNFPPKFEIPADYEEPEDFNFSNMPSPGGSFGGVGSEDVKLQYIDDDPSSYSNIFDSAKTDITGDDQEVLIASLKDISRGARINETVNIDHVIRYFVVHNYAVNGDSYTGSMIHNYYLYEENGILSMLPWDYNLAFGTFQGNNAQSSVNDPIDTPMSTGSSDRPMIDWILENEEYLALYHEYYEQFLNTVDIQQIIDQAHDIIAPYVQKDPSKFCTYEEYITGIDTLKSFCSLRSKSIIAQLNGSIPTTSEGQNNNQTSLIDATSINLSDMGSMGSGMGSRGKGQFDQNAEPPKPEMSVGVPMPEEMERSDGQQLTKDNRRSPSNGLDTSNPFSQQVIFSYSDWILIGCCTTVLLGAIFFVLFYKRRKQ